MNIVLIGYRGTGKSVVGKLLAISLQIQCVAMDKAIVERVGMSIPEIVKRHGWPYFRDRESEMALELAGRDNIIIDAGGGVIERTENMKKLQKNSIIFWLKASVDTIVLRIQSSKQRPALTSEKTFTEEVEEILKERIPKYKNFAHYEINTDKLTPEQIRDTIIDIRKKAING